jgi:hypothetical protein
MKTPKLTKAGGAAKRAMMSGFHILLEAIRTRLARGYRLRFTHKAIVICIKRPTDGSEGGGGYVIPRDNKLAVTRKTRELVFHAPIDRENRCVASLNIEFGSESDAVDALHRIQKRLLSNRPLVWATRLVALGIVWLFVSSYLQVKARESAAAQQTIASNSGEALTPLPGAQSDLQAFPGATSDSAPLPMGSSEPDPVLPTPSPAPSPAAATTSASPPASGLAGFGLDASTAAPSNATPTPTASVAPQAVAEVAASGIPAKGPGCDPALAFKAPVR